MPVVSEGALVAFKSVQSAAFITKDGGIGGGLGWELLFAGVGSFA
jgi:hypothetical protein